MEPSATSTTVTGPVRERLQAGTEDAPVLDRPAPLRCFHDSGAGYKYPYLLTSGFPCIQALESPGKSVGSWKVLESVHVLQSPGIYVWFKVNGMHSAMFGLLLSKAKSDKRTAELICYHSRFD